MQPVRVEFVGLLSSAAAFVAFSSSIDPSLSSAKSCPSKGPEVLVDPQDAVASPLDGTLPAALSQLGTSEQPPHFCELFEFAGNSVNLYKSLFTSTATWRARPSSRSTTPTTSGGHPAYRCRFAKTSCDFLVANGSKGGMDSGPVATLLE